MTRPRRATAVPCRPSAARRAGARAVVAAVLALLAGCSSGGPVSGGSASGTSAAPRRLGAAEPSRAPTPTGSPAGGTVTVGSSPEGLVHDPVTGLLAVGVRDPDRLVLVDAATLTVVREVPLQGHVRHLQLAGPGGPVLVPEEDADRLAVVSLPDGAVTSYPVGKSPHDATAVTDGYVTGDEFGRSFTTVLGGRPHTYREVDQPGGLIGFGDRFALVDVGDYTVSTFDVATGRRLAQLPGGAGPTHGVRVGTDRLVVTDTRGGALLTYAVDPLRRLSSVPLPGGPYGIAVDALDAAAPVVWVTLTATNQVVGFDVSTGTPRELERLATVAQPDTVAAAGRDVWVTGTRAGLIQHLTRSTG